jgi:hypothetical protein
MVLDSCDAIHSALSSEFRTNIPYEYTQFTGISICDELQLSEYEEMKKDGLEKTFV